MNRLSLDRRAFIKLAAASAAPAVVCPGQAKAADDSAAPREIASEPQLFLDDWIVADRTGLERTLHRPAKQGLIKHADGSDWDRGDVYHGNIVCRDNAGRFHMTYRYFWSDPGVSKLHPYIGDDKALWYRESIGYATSNDGIRWEKPQLGLVDGPTGFRRQNDYPLEVPMGTSKANNLGCPFDFICDLHAHGNITDPNKRFLLRVVRRNDTHPFAEAVESHLYFAADWPDFARDRDWKKKLTPIPGGDLSPRGFRSLFGYDHDQRVWFAMSQDRLDQWIPRGGRDIARCTSPDLVHWTQPQFVLPVARDEAREKTNWTEYMDLLGYRVGGRRSGAWLGQLDIFNSDRSSPQYMMPGLDVWRKGTTELRLIISRDAGRTWQRVAGRQAWLPHHQEPHGFDRLVFATFPVRVGDELYFYYSAWDGDHLIFNRDGSLFEPGFARTGRTAWAKLRVDGYVSLDAGAKKASLMTKPLRFSGARLVANLHAPRGALRAELQDPDGRAIDGFSLADAIPARGDGLELPLRWRAGDVRTLAGRTIRVRFELTGGSLYGFRFAS